MNDTSETTRRSFLGAVAAFAATTLAPGIILYARSPNEPVTNAVRWGMLVDASQCDKDCNGCVEACNKEFGLVSHGRPDGSAMDPQSDGDRPRHRPYAIVPGHVPALRPTALRRRLSHRRVVQTGRRNRADQPSHLRRLPLLHDGLPLQGAQLRPRGGDRPEALRAARQGHVGGLHHVRPPGRRRPYPACVEACAATGHVAMLFGDLKIRTAKSPSGSPAVNTTQIRSDLRTDPGVRYQGL